MNPYALQGKTILVTGASSGLGRQIAISCSRMGARLVVTGRDGTRLTDTVAALTGDAHRSHVADLTVASEREASSTRPCRLTGWCMPPGSSDWRQPS